MNLHEQIDRIKQMIGVITEQSNTNNKGKYSVVLVGGLEHRQHDKSLTDQISLLSRGLGLDEKKIKGFHHNDPNSDVVKFIESNPNIKVFLFSQGCQKAGEVSNIQNLNKQKIYIIEPFAPNGNNPSVSNAIGNGVPKKNVFYGEDRGLKPGSFGKGIGGTPSGSKDHFGALTTVGQKIG